MSAEGLESLEESIALLSDDDAMAEIAEAESAIVDGDVVVGVDAVWALRREA